MAERVDSLVRRRSLAPARRARPGEHRDYLRIVADQAGASLRFGAGLGIVAGLRHGRTGGEPGLCRPTRPAAAGRSVHGHRDPVREVEQRQKRDFRNGRQSSSGFH
ncbi:hypothetical protein SPHINGO391_350219 [Sphingomonas aurantiaca]|uniref:Uncharacterized protein n=1 Tax=Sphingomonas aurantiaca TaxID=185949 RepID=A0A5E7Y4E9_9SPHN|nr:hypothetical protein SPHINGO391_350219 [Sphingomonas aurantiaca]